MKIEAKYILEKPFVLVEDLPEEQKKLFIEWYQTNTANDGLCTYIVNYSDYVRWYEIYFNPLHNID